MASKVYQETFLNAKNVTPRSGLLKPETALGSFAAAKKWKISVV